MSATPKWLREFRRPPAKLHRKLRWVTNPSAPGKIQIETKREPAWDNTSAHRRWVGDALHETHVPRRMGW